MRVLSLLTLLIMTLMPSIPLHRPHPMKSHSRSSSLRPVHTYSIIAIDPERNEMGYAVQSHWFNVGSIVGWAEPGVGVVATQSLVNIGYGPQGLALMRQGLTAKQALNAVTSVDPGRDVRQVAMLDIHGNIAAYTGKRCIPEAGHHIGKNFSAQANLMDKNTVWEAMARAFESAEGDLADRLMAALKAAEAEGGDIRGRQSAAMKIVRIHPEGPAWQNVLVDLRVDDHPDPLKELERLLHVHRAYEAMNRGDLALERKAYDEAASHYQKAISMLQSNPEPRFWFAVGLVNAGDLQRAIPEFQKVFQKDPKWWTLLKRLPDVGFFPDDPEIWKALESIAPEKRER